MSVIIDPSKNELLDPNTKIAPEDETRKRIIARAIYMGCGEEVKAIIKKYDNLLKNCTNDKEREAIGILGVTELSKYMDCTSLTVNGIVIQDDSDFEKQQNKR